MKRIFRIGLLLLLYIVTLAVVQVKTSPTYTEAGIQCLSKPDQAVITVIDQPVPVMALLSIGETNSPYLVALRPGDVEKSLMDLISYCNLLDQGQMSPMYSIMNSGYMKPTNLMGISRQRFKGQYRLDIGEITSGQAATCRHT